MWIKNCLNRRLSRGYGELLRGHHGEPNDYNIFLRLYQQLFQHVVELVSPLIIKQDTIMRTCSHFKVSSNWLQL